MKKVILSLFLIIITSQLFAVVSSSKFGAIPNDGKNDLPALQKAVDACKKSPGSTLIIEPGVYDIETKEAVEIMNNMMDHKMGRNPERIVYTPNYKYPVGLKLFGLKNTTIKADNVTFRVTGWMEPVSIQFCQNLTLTGLTIDYKTIPHSEGKVIKVESGYFDVELTDREWLRDNCLITRMMFWDLKQHRLLGHSSYFPQKTQKLNDTTLRVFTGTRPDWLGTIALMNHTLHFRPAILLLESKNTKLERVTIHSQPGMGIVGHRCENILMQGLRVVPKAGNYQSTNTDATHFTSCTGTIRFDGCMFEGQGDDATNVHGYYHSFTKDLGNQVYEIKLLKRMNTHCGVLDHPDVGNTLEILNKNTLEVVTKVIVKKIKTFPKEWRSEITLDKKLPGNIRDFLVIDVTRLPRLEFVNSTVGSHLARAVLVKTRNVLIENCIFHDGTGTIIHIGAEGDWQEGPGSANVHIRNNRLLRGGRGDGTNEGACAIAINVKAADRSATNIHKNIIIEGNIIEGENSPNGIAVRGAENVIIRYNEFTGCRKNVDVQHSQNVKITP